VAAHPFQAGSPLRGLTPFGEADREIFFGRDRDRDEVVKMVTADGFRAGLLYGEPGVGKTSLVQAGLIPELRDLGALVLPCSDPSRPAQAFAEALLAASRGGVAPHQGEAPLAFAARVIANAPHHQLHVFVFDDVDTALAAGAGTSERVVGDIVELFTRVLSRGGGRARVLFVSAAENVHVLGQLERRTGSLFPPSSRHELLRLPAPEASAVLERTLGLAGFAAAPDLVEAVVAGLGRSGPVLPADLQIAAAALAELRVGSGAELARLGGARELETRWLEAAARATGHERTGLRILGELAREGEPRTSSAVAARLGVSAGEVARSLGAIEQRGLVTRRPGTTLDASGGADDAWDLRHPVLAPRLREATAPARAAARRTYDLLGSKAQAGQRLTLPELYALRHEQIAPVTDAERAVVRRSKRFYLTILAAIAALPVVLIVLMAILNAGRVHLDVTATPAGDRVIVRSGRAGLSSFHWLGFGHVVADPGLSRSMIDPAAWRRIANRDVGGGRGGWAGQIDQVVRPELAALVRYATTGEESAIRSLAELARGDDERAELLVALRPIARGTAAEVALVEEALASHEPALQKAAVQVAGAAAQRGAEVYQGVLVTALVAPDAELRRIAQTAVRGLGGERAHELVAAALAREPEPAARRELMLEAAGAAGDETPSADRAAAALADPQATDAQRQQALQRLQRALTADPEAGIAAAARLLGNPAAPVPTRIEAVRMLRDAIGDRRGDLGAVADASHAAVTGGDDALRAAALPLYALSDPTRAAEQILALAGHKPAKGLRIAIATAWGELARPRPEEASEALERLLKDADPEVRAAAAAAYGHLGRPAQDTLNKMVKKERFDVAVGAAHGLAATAEVGASMSVANDGIYHLWKQKGRPRREAARVYARLAKRKPAAVLGMLGAAARMGDDPSLHPIGVEGLCNAAGAGSAEARTQLGRATGNPSTDVRRLVIRCVADGGAAWSDAASKAATKIARDLIDDTDASIRVEAARVLAQAARGGPLTADQAAAMLRRLRDPSREVRLVAMRALPALGREALETDRARKGADRDPLGAAFEAGDEAEKLALVRAARELAHGELVELAIGDASPLVRVEAVDLSIATGTRVAATIATSLADADPQVRRAALARIAEGATLDAGALDRALALGVRDPDPELRRLALTTLARVVDKEAVLARLGRALASRAEGDRAAAAAAAIGLVERDAAAGAQLLAPLLADPAHDVRVAMLPALGAAWASTHAPEELAKLLRGAERHAMRRLTATAAFVILARTDAGRPAARAALEQVARAGAPLARRAAQLALGLIAADADGVAFLQQLVP
jgi:HEAT repeat protein